jgi:hypothetical protein
MNLIEAAERALEALNDHAGNYKLTKEQSEEQDQVANDLEAAIEAAERLAVLRVAGAE